MVATEGGAEGATAASAEDAFVLFWCPFIILMLSLIWLQSKILSVKNSMAWTFWRVPFGANLAAQTFQQEPFGFQENSHAKNLENDLVLATGQG